ncbi:RagB/SusD family nutrient uptake outer membrane protein [Arthrospiribacter ruber]|uniref:RagB/SusD family nutrient uptake outer membrane protein n=1 Tax=Arthrospiribacter ruber TaxID=2487934 RepID=A0A951IW88_9BACT|nr:RagB/SusD family nutrient uptake outer membrane protein [Arthrospiribacter ruber]MBW3466861.1 RagB/SusD family nutrient uptake outer membrane protein [Arthrospiribacter ruber]
MKNLIRTVLTLTLLSVLWACENFLDEKPDKALVTISTLDDMQGLLDNNTQAMNSETYFKLIRSDEFEADPSLLRSVQPWIREVYLWAEEPFGQDEIAMDWSRQYLQIMNTNIILEEIEKVSPVNQAEELRKNAIRASAHFFRGLAYFNLAQVFAQAYVPGGDNSSLSFPLRTVADPNAHFERATVQEVYEFIIEDLELSLEGLPDNVIYPTRPNLSSGHALLARIYLSMGMYEEAGKYSELVLVKNSSLTNFNSLVLTGTNPFQRFNEETIFFSNFYFASFLSSQLLKVSDSFANLFSEEDLRKSAFFRQNPGGWYVFIGHYTADEEFFSGITTPEMILISAEVAARKGEFPKAKSLLQQLAENRFAPENLPGINEMPEEVVLEYVLDERKRELFGRGLRWSDIRRLNQEIDFAVVLERSFEEERVVIQPGDARYTLDIPPREKRLEGF